VDRPATPSVLHSGPEQAVRGVHEDISHFQGRIDRSGQPRHDDARQTFEMVGIYNVAEQPSYSELEWATRVAAAAGWKGAFVVLPPDEMPPHLRMPGNLEQHWSVDTSRIRSELGYREPVDLDDAIARTIAWERANAPARPLAAIDYAADDAAIAG